MERRRISGEKVEEETEKETDVSWTRDETSQERQKWKTQMRV